MIFKFHNSKFISFNNIENMGNCAQASNIITPIHKDITNKAQNQNLQTNRSAKSSTKVQNRKCEQKYLIKAQNINDQNRQPKNTNNLEEKSQQKVQKNAKSAQSLPSQKDFVYEIRDLIISKNQLCSVFSKQFFSHLSQMYSVEYWQVDSRQLLIKYLIDYIKFTVSQINPNQKNETQYQIGNISQKFGKDLYKLFTNTKMKNVWALQTLKYIDKFKSKSFNFQFKQQTQEIVNDIKNMCSNSTAGLIFLSSYFIKCCLELEKNNVDPKEVNQILKKIVQQIKQKFSPQKKMKEQMKYLSRDFEQSELDKLNQEKISYKIKAFKFKGTNKQQEIQNFIMEMVELSKKYYNSFTQLTSTACLQNEGFFYKSNLKLQQKKQKLQLLRVKEKLLQKKICIYYDGKTYHSKNISQLKKAQEQYFLEVLKKVYQSLDKIQFTVSDLLRGKCMFNKISHINRAAQAIIDKVAQRAKKGEDIQIVQIENRLKKITADFVLKIRMGELVCEFQLALKFSQAQNQVHHKMYEIQRSKIFTPVTMLFKWHESLALSYFKSIENVLGQCKKKDINKLKQQVEDLKQFIKFTNVQKQSENVIIFASKQNYDYIRKIKNSIDNFEVPTTLIQKSLFRSGVCQKQMKQYKTSLKTLQQYSKIFPQDQFLYYEAGELQNHQKKYNRAVQYYCQFRNFSKNPKQNKQLINEAMIKVFRCLCKIGKNCQAFNAIDYIINLTTQNFGKQSIQYAKTLTCIGQVHQSLGKMDKSIEFYNEAITLMQKLNTKSDSNYAHTYANKGQAYKKMGKFAAALQNLNIALSLSQNINGKQSLQTGKILSKIGSTYQVMSKYKQAQKFYMKNIYLIQNIISNQSPQYIEALLILTNLLISNNQLKKAQQYITQCQQYYQYLSNIYQFSYMQMCKVLGKYYEKKHQFLLAIQYFQKAIKFFQTEPQKNPQVISLYQNIAVCNQSLGQIGKAEQIYENITDKIQNIYGEDSIQMASLLNNIGHAYLVSSRPQLAIQKLLLSIQKYRKLKSQTDLGYMSALSNIMFAYISIGEQSKGFDFELEINKIYEVTVGLDSISFAQHLLGIGRAYKTIKNYEKAKNYIQKALTIFTKSQDSLSIQICNKQLDLIQQQIKQNGLQHNNQQD